MTGKPLGRVPAIEGAVLVGPDPHAHRGSIVYEPMTMTLFMAVCRCGWVAAVLRLSTSTVYPTSSFPIRPFDLVWALVEVEHGRGA